MARPGPDGYRDIIFKVQTPSGHIAEIQVHVAAIEAIKNEVHPLYEARQAIERQAKAEGRDGNYTPAEAAERNRLNAEMKALYDAAWERTTSASQSAALMPPPFRSMELMGNERPPGVSNALPNRPPSAVGMSAVGTPSTSNSLEPLGSPADGLRMSVPPGSSIARTPTREQVFTARGRRLDVEHRVVEAADLVTSDHPNYPAELQPRDRKGRLASDAQVAEIAQRLEPKMLGAASEADRGAPIVGPDNVVESGNGRVMALRQVHEGRYANSPEKAAAYRAHLESLGYEVKGMKQPVLARFRTSAMTPAERAEFGIEANQGTAAELSPVERAQADAKNLDVITMGKLQPGELTSAANAPFVRAFAELIPASERGAYVDAHNVLSQAGERRLQGAILAKAYGGSEASNVTLGRMLEGTDESLKSTLNALQDAAPKFAELRQMIAEGTLDEKYDIAPAIVSAVEDVAKLKASGRSLAEHLATADMFSAKSLAIRAFYGPDGRLIGREKAAAALEKYAEAAMRERTDQAALFSTEAFTPSELMRHAVVPRSGDLFGLRAEAKPEVPDTVESPRRAYGGKSVQSRDGQQSFNFGDFETRADTSPGDVGNTRKAPTQLLSYRDRRARASLPAAGFAPRLCLLERAKTVNSSLSMILTAAEFAAHKHRDQRRKDAAASPYINHPLALASILGSEGEVTDPVTIAAALLHDTVEDTETTPAELESVFGREVAQVVAEVTDDKSLPRTDRKRLQIEHAGHLSERAKLVKLADKIANIRDVAASPPSDWSLERRREYFDWAKRVVDELGQVSPILRTAFDSAYRRKP